MANGSWLMVYGLWSPPTGPPTIVQAAAPDLRRRLRNKTANITKAPLLLSAEDVVGYAMSARILSDRIRSYLRLVVVSAPMAAITTVIGNQEIPKATKNLVTTTKRASEPNASRLCIVPITYSHNDEVTKPYP